MKASLIAFAAVFALTMLLTQGTNAQTRQARAAKQIDSYARSIERIIDGRKRPDLVFADTASYDDGKVKWHKFVSIKELEKYREKTETYSIAYSWKRNGRIVATNFTLFSPSGDWAKYVMHYFRGDGSLAKVTSELRTFYGDFVMTRTEYFDPAGRRLKTGTEYRDLKTKKPKKPTKDMLAENPMANSDDHYKRVRDLPFAKLVK